jgi:hypothetical protein
VSRYLGFFGDHIVPAILYRYTQELRRPDLLNSKFLPTKLAEWIGENMQDELGFPDKRDPNKWSVSELNDILRKHLVRDRKGCSLRTFGCVEWESELYRGIMRSRCYPFNLQGHRFHNMNIQVLDNSYT